MNETREVCPKCGRPIRYEELTVAGVAIRARIECACVEEERRKLAEEGRTVVVDATRTRIGLPKRFARCTFDNFKPDKGQADAYGAAKRFASEFADGKDGGVGLLLAGGVGCGKTHLAAAIVNFLVDRARIDDADAVRAALAKRGDVLDDGDSSLPLGIIFTGTTALMTRIRDGYDGKGVGDETERCKTARLLVLDDFGAERQSEWVRERLFEIINARYEEELPTVITTNDTVEEMRDKLGDRITDRLRACCRYVATTSGSHRATAI